MDLSSKDFSLSSLGLGYSSVASFLKSVLKNKFLEAEDEEDKDIRGAEFDEHWTECLSVVITELIHWMVRPSLALILNMEREIRRPKMHIFTKWCVLLSFNESHPSVYTSRKNGEFYLPMLRIKLLISDMKSEVVVPF